MHGSRMVVLLVEDDPQAAETLTDVLELAGYLVWRAETASDAKALLAQRWPDLIILDLQLPDADGLVLCSSLRAMADVPIIICSGTVQQRDRTLALKLGADDFIGKPFDIYELQARVEAVMRRAHKLPIQDATPADLSYGELTLSPARRRATLGSRELQLTPAEYRLLLTLMSQPDVVVPREDLAEKVLGSRDSAHGNALDAHIRRMRLKLAGGPSPAPQILAVRGFGYQLAPPEPLATV